MRGDRRGGRAYPPHSRVTYPFPLSRLAAHVTRDTDRTTRDADHATGGAADRPLTTRVGRVSLRVGDLDRVAAFYETVVGLDRLDGDDERAVLGAGGDPLLELLARPDLPERGREETGLFHAAFLYPDRGALGDALARVERGRRLDGASDHAVSEALYLTDPEGNGVELYRDRPHEQWPTADGRVEMVTEPLDLDALRTAAAGDTDAPGGTTVGHVHLEVSSVPESRAFYVDGLGLGLRQEWSGAAFVAGVSPTLDAAYHHHVGLNTWNGRTEPARGLGLDRFELVVRDDATLDRVAARLERSGAAPDRTDAGLTVADPDGISLRIHVEE